MKQWNYLQKNTAKLANSIYMTEKEVNVLSRKNYQNLERKKTKIEFNRDSVVLLFCKNDY